ncbi:GntR family transcriptional regulator [Acetobacteraceae bacterium H6797]|nr:GntR family transcriptional regulator [Acetobacteraceae bacterium H6797]
MSNEPATKTAETGHEQEAAPTRPPRRVPVHLAIRQYIQDLIASPDYAPGDRVPSERALAEQLGANRMTVRKAIEGLVAAGVLERDSTSGTRIAMPRVTRPAGTRTGQGVGRVIADGGGVPGHKLLHFEQGHASPRVAERLQIPQGTELVVFRRLWSVNGTPFCIETSHVPAALVPDLAIEDLLREETQSFYAMLKARYGIHAGHAERVISAGPVQAMEGRLLDLKPGASALLLDLLIRDQSGRPVEYVRSVNHPQLVVFKTASTDLPV